MAAAEERRQQQLAAAEEHRKLQVAAATAAEERKKQQVAAAEEQKRLAEEQKKAQIAAAEERNRLQLAAMDNRPVQAARPVADPAQIANLSVNDIINVRGMWDNMPGAMKRSYAPVASAAPPAPQTQVAVSSARRAPAGTTQVASAGSDLTASIGPFARPDRAPPEAALGYAAYSAPQQAQSERGRRKTAGAADHIAPPPAAAPAPANSRDAASAAPKPAPPAAAATRPPTSPCG